MPPFAERARGSFGSDGGGEGARAESTLPRAVSILVERVETEDGGQNKTTQDGSTRSAEVRCAIQTALLHLWVVCVGAFGV
jgi:hypothetical protein